jgi:PAS domain S-box-containing protein
VTEPGDRPRRDHQQHVEDGVPSSEQRLRLIVDTIPGLIAIMTPQGEVEHVNRQALDYFGRTLEELKQWGQSDAVHPDDLPRVSAAWARAIAAGVPYELEHRMRRADGVYRWFQLRGSPLHDDGGRIVRWYVLMTDIDERKATEERLRRSEDSLLEAQRLSHTGSWRHDVASGRVFFTPETHRIFGITPDEDALTPESVFRRIHPDDRQRVRDLFERAETRRTAYEAYYRIVLPDGTLKHLHSIGHPVSNHRGELVEFVGTVANVTEQRQARARLESAFEQIKRLKDRLQEENLALREEVAQASMFEEIVGSSAPLKSMLSHVSKVAPTDSTVLISGETGTGKELIARAIHKHSRRADRPFVSVNCAAIPPSLIASELFGHEKGAFTGALQQRRGRFELAHTGTIFLDEIGEVPADTQLALLRVLQERQCERVGGSRPIAVDVRVIAATNRDLQAAIAAGTFRSDLFYRLNVFPIRVPPLRQRREDIPMLVEYFVKRFAESMAKRIRSIDKRTLEVCERYWWPGNIRELQNIVERSVILCTGDTFSIQDAWLEIREPVRPDVSGPLTQSLLDQERGMIEAALAESGGKVAGARGAAARLGIPPSTLDSKIKQLRIAKGKFTTPSS